MTESKLVGELRQLDRTGVRYLRLPPQSGDMVRIAKSLRAAPDGAMASEGAADASRPGRGSIHSFYTIIVIRNQNDRLF